MKNFITICAAGLLGLAALGISAASAQQYRDRDYSDNRPQYCGDDHDHRTHDTNYYDSYDEDRYYRANPRYTGSASAHDNRYNSDRYEDRNYRQDRNHYDDRRGGRYTDGHGRNGRYISSRSHRIPGLRATAYAVEREYYTRRGSERVCTVTVNGPDAHHVGRRDLRWVASTHCSRYARVQYA